MTRQQEVDEEDEGEDEDEDEDNEEDEEERQGSPDCMSEGSYIYLNWQPP